MSVYVRIKHNKLTSRNDYVKLKIKVNLPQLLCNVVSAAQKSPTLSDLVGFELTVYTIRYITSTQNPPFCHFEPQKRRCTTTELGYNAYFEL